MIAEFQRQWSDVTARLDWLDRVTHPTTQVAIDKVRDTALHLRGFYPAPKSLESDGHEGVILRWTWGMVMEIHADGSVRKYADAVLREAGKRQLFDRGN